MAVGTPEGLKGEMKILGMVMMPEEFDAVVYSDAWTTEKLCKRSIKQRDSCYWVQQPTGVNATLRQLLPTEQFAASNRGIGCIFARYFVGDTNPASDKVQYTMRNVKNRAGAAPNVLQLQPTTNFLDFNLADCDDTAPVGEPPGSPYAKQCFSAQMVCGRSTKTMTNARWFLVNATAAPPAGFETTINVVREGAAIAAACTFLLFRWNGGQPIFVQEKTFGAGDPDQTELTWTLQGALGVTDFYTVQYVGDVDEANFNPATNIGFSLYVWSFCSQLCQKPVRGAYQNLTQMGPMTTVAASMRFTDMAAPLNIQGEMTVATVRTNGTWWRMFQACLGGGPASGSVFTVVVNYRDSYLGKLMNGGYGWHLPFKQHQFELEDCCVIDYDKALVLDHWWDLEDESIWNVFCGRTTNNGACIEALFCSSTDLVRARKQR